MDRGPETACRMLVDTINATGGVRINKRGRPEPLGDPEWIDLGEAYLAACATLNLDPVISEEPA